MSKGSSRSLIRSLEQLFRDSKSVLSVPPATVTTLDEYIERHDTFTSMNNNKLSDELYHIYKEFVVDDSAKELGFLQILATLSPFIVETKELMLWIDRYYTPAVNSAGRDSKFVSACRQFLKSILVVKESSDQQLQAIRKEHAEILLKRLLDTCLILPDSGKKVTSNSDSQETEERQRFIRLNCRQLIEVFYEKDLRTHLEMMDSYVRNPQSRLAALVLLASVAKPYSENLKIIAETSLFTHILNCALLDRPVQVVSVSVSLLCLIIPHIAKCIDQYLPQLFAIYSRLVCWDLGIQFPELVYDESTPKLEKDEPNYLQPTWEPLEDGIEENDIYSPEFKKLFLVLYGLFPRTVCDFVGDAASIDGLFRFPADTVRKLSEKRPKIESTSQKLVQSFLFNQALLKYRTAEDEISDKTRYGEATAEDLAMYVMSLDPQVSGPMPIRDMKKGSFSLSRMKSREDSLVSGLAFKTPNYELKTESPSIPDDIHPFSKSSSEYYDSQPTSQNDLNGLLNTHRLLFSNSDQPSSGNEYLRRMSVQSIPENIDESLSSSTESDVKIEESGPGTQLQFYQRELLISLNEQEFLSHSNHLIIKSLKTSRDEQASLSRELQNLKALELANKSLQEKNEQLIGELQTSRNHLSSMRLQRSQENVALLKEVNELRGEVGVLQTQLGHLRAESKGFENEVSKLKLRSEPREADIVSLSNKIATLESDLQAYENAEPRVIADEHETTKGDSSSPEVTTLQEELRRSNDSFEVKTKALENHYKGLVESLQQEVVQLRSVNSDSSSKKVSEIVSSYESKIAILKAKVTSLQSALQERDDDLMHITTTQPINIPISRPIFGLGQRGDSSMRAVGSSGLGSALNIKQSVLAGGGFGNFVPGPPSASDSPHFLGVGTPTFQHTNLAWSPDQPLGSKLTR
ncbi:unnamed protein product [Kuraishia capsulata CBS 1993]|uniref:Uncharacterized protein n=1 Tax=Kuraishia capsulata CBS 1993 TaxID=1382522 RepID=W6MTW2_9ASCO|nr:uncharacterized protein KUCA_T00005942001 [Kuraishia capsulata CBS 1993]CDK29948.1 unnamed protein product [Kuraishia capsulata CBS 1993]